MSAAVLARTILYIEDDPSSQRLVERMLMHAGYRVLVAERGLEGIDIARREMPDLILTDINLPDLSGREITTMLRSDERFRTTPIVALTAQGKEERDMTLAAGITGYLTTPVDVDSLSKTVEYYLGGGHDKVETEKLSQARNLYIQEIVRRLEVRIRELESANSALTRLDRMKDTFIQLTAHELRTPLTVVSGYGGLLEATPSVKELMDSDDSAKTVITGLVSSIDRMQNVINEIMTISRIMTNQIDLSIKNVNLKTLIPEVIASYQDATTKRRLTIHFDATSAPENMRADSELLRLALSNLIGNAIKYTPDGGSISVSAKIDEETKQVRISVKDCGIGISKDEQKNIFERFHTANNTLLHSTSKTAFGGGGLGLGLAVCKGIVAAHSGQIWVESAGRDPEKLPGSEFIMLLPVTSQNPAQGKVWG
jgi:signal transduction histidine kinase